MVVAAVAVAAPPAPPLPPTERKPPPLPPWPPFPPIAVALFRGAVVGCVLPALAETDSPSPPGMPLSSGLTPSAPGEPSSPWTVTISARALGASIIVRAANAAPASSTPVKSERWIDFISALSRRSPANETPFANIQLRFEHLKIEISMPDYTSV
jgi:hypothetical protein